MGGCENDGPENRAAFAHLPARRQGALQSFCGSPTGGDSSHRAALAQTICRARARWLGRRCATRSERSAHQSPTGAGHRGSHAAQHSACRYSLEHADHGRKIWGQQRYRLPDLGCSWIAASSNQDLQALQGQAVCGEVDRRGRPLPQSSRQGAGLMRGREIPSAGVGSNPARPAHEAGPLRDHDP